VENATHANTAARDHRGSGIIVVSSRGRRCRGRVALPFHCAIDTGHLVKMAGKAYSLDARGGAMASTRRMTVAVLMLAAAEARAEGRRDVPYVATSPAAVQQMIELARLRAGDVVYDLGCGDGRIVIAAVRVPDVRGVCVEIDPGLVRLAREEADKAGVSSKITFVQGDIFEVPIQDATVVMLYLLREVNLRLRPRLWRELRAGTRVVSNTFDMGDWEPERQVSVPPGSTTIYSWTISGARR